MRLVLWASPGLYVASLHPSPGTPRHVEAETLAKVWKKLGLSGGLTPKSMAQVEATVTNALKQVAYVSLVNDESAWTAHTVRHGRNVEQRAATAHEALDAVLAMPVEPMPARPVARPPSPPVAPGRAKQPTLF